MGVLKAPFLLTNSTLIDCMCESYKSFSEPYDRMHCPVQKSHREALQVLVLKLTSKKNTISTLKNSNIYIRLRGFTFIAEKQK